MKVKLNYLGHEIMVTTEHEGASYYGPIVLIDGALTALAAEYEGDVTPTLLDLVADAAGIWRGPATRHALADLAAELFPRGLECGADADRVVSEFRARQAA